MIKNSYQSIINFGESLQPFLLLIFRLIWGYLFFKSGLGKLENIDRVAAYFSSLGIPFPEASAYIVGWVECIGGLCFIVGFATRLVAIPLIINMIVAMLTAHWDSVTQAFQHPQQLLSESPITFLIASLVLLAFGPGFISLDSLFARFFFSKSNK